MNWAHVLLAGYIGAVIAIVVGMFRKKAGWARSPARWFCGGDYRVESV